MSMPGFTAARSLFCGGRHHVASHEGQNIRGESTVVAASFGGPGNVPIGYNLECKLIPYQHCDLRGCWTEYYEYCTLTPVRYSGALR